MNTEFFDGTTKLPEVQLCLWSEQQINIKMYRINYEIYIITYIEKHYKLLCDGRGYAFVLADVNVIKQCKLLLPY